MSTNPAIDAALPKGVTDFLPEQADKIGFIEAKICRVFEMWGFRRIITPLLEFQDVLAAGMGDDLKEKTFRFDDRHSGRLLAVPPDITPQVARIEATRMAGYPLPHRLYYHGRVLRHAELQSGRSREIFQAGVELIGLESPEADAEMVAMAIEVMQGLGFAGFTIDLGHVGFFHGIMAAAGLPPQATQQLQQAIAKKDTSAVAQLLAETPVSDRAREEISALPRLFGGCEVLAEARRIVSNDRSRQALDNLAQVVDILTIHGLADYLTIDLGEIRGLQYHTGVTFEGFVAGLGEPVCGGGRYDDLMARYGRPAPATGFAFNTLALLKGLERQPDVEASTARDYLIFNLLPDRRAALEFATALRRQGFSVARDIIRRELDQSIAYARRMNIRRLVVIGDHRCSEGQVYLLRVADGSGLVIGTAALLAGELPADW